MRLATKILILFVILAISLELTNACSSVPDNTTNARKECCKILLINWEGGSEGNQTYLNQLNGTRNGHPNWISRMSGGNSAIYYEKGKWIIGGERQPWGISNTSPKCPEMVQKWSPGPGNRKNLPLVWGKIRCAVEDQALERCLQDINDCENVQI